MTEHSRHPTTGMLLIVASVMILPLGDAAIKLVSESYSSAQLVWVRFFFPFWIIVPMTWGRHGLKCFITDRTMLLVGRSLFMLGASLCFVTSLRYMPLADATAIASSNPLILMVLLGIVLRERIPLTLWVAVSLGMVAILVIIRPGLEGYNSASLFALGAALFSAGFLFCNRLLRNRVPPLVTMSYQLFFALLVLTPTMPFEWVKPVPVDLLLMIAGGLFNVLGHLLMIRAFDFAEASFLAPFLYSVSIIQVVIGYFLFGDFPDTWTWLGIILLVGIGVYLSLKDHDFIGR